MTLLYWMTGAGVASWLALAPWLDSETRVAQLLGMTGPLLVAGVTWRLTERTYRRHPERLTALMVKAFAGKMVFFGAYVAVAVTELRRPTVFVVGFTGYFIALHAMEAFWLRRLFADGARST